MLTLRKGDAVKILSPESSLIPLLVHEGWVADRPGNQRFVEAITQVSDADLDALRAQAEALGLKVHHKAGADKIREMIEAAKGE